MVGEPIKGALSRNAQNQPLRKIKILIAEPDSITARDLKDMLPSLGLGYTVTSIVSTGEDALQKAKQDTPDLLLLDIALPGKLNGIQAGRRIRTLYDFPIIYITTHSDEKSLQKTKLVEPDGYVLKPIDERELRIAIEIALRTHAKVKKTEKALRESERRFRRFEEELKRSQEELRKLSRHLHFARERESKRISREIHDELGQALTALKMELTWISNNLPLTHELHKLVSNKAKSMSSLVDSTIKKVQRIASELRPGVLDDLGLVPAIEWLGQDFQNRTKIKCLTELASFDYELDPECSTAVFRILQEALTNVARHARASRVRVSLKEKKSKLELKIRDNGRGIAEKDVLSPDSLGLVGMRERLRPFEGDVRIQGIPEKGTTLVINLPINRIRKH